MALLHVIKSNAIILLLTVVVAVVTFCSHWKLARQRTEMDAFKIAFEGISIALPKQSKFSLLLIDVPQHIQFYVRYFLAPRLVYYPVTKSDTVMIIGNVAAADSLNNIVSSQRKVMWHHQDSQFVYLLSCSR
jgi:hypothetical protein